MGDEKTKDVESEATTKQDTETSGRSHTVLRDADGMAWPRPDAG